MVSVEEPTKTVDVTVPIPTDGEDQQLPKDGDKNKDSYTKAGMGEIETDVDNVEVETP